MTKVVIYSLSMVVFLLVACNSNPTAPPPEVAAGDIVFATLPPATDTPAPLPSPTTAPTAAATSAAPAEAPPTNPPPTDTPTPTPVPDWLTTFGRTADDLMYLGNPDAPVTIIDFSDFM